MSAPPRDVRKIRKNIRKIRPPYLVLYKPRSPEELVLKRGVCKSLLNQKITLVYKRVY